MAQKSRRAETLALVLKQCGNDLSRESVMQQAAALENYQGSMLLPGIEISTGPAEVAQSEVREFRMARLAVARGDSPPSPFGLRRGSLLSLRERRLVGEEGLEPSKS